MRELRLSAEREKKFRALLEKYESPRCALLPTLYLAQEQFGFIDGEVAAYVAQLLGMPSCEVSEAVSFYTLFKKKDMGRWCIQVCNNITCAMLGSQALLAVVREELGIGPQEVTPDRLFSLVPVQCLGSCDTAPVAQINETYLEKLDPETFRKLLRDLREGRKQSNFEMVI